MAIAVPTFKGSKLPSPSRPPTYAPRPAPWAPPRAPMRHPPTPGVRLPPVPRGLPIHPAIAAGMLVVAGYWLWKQYGAVQVPNTWLDYGSYWEVPGNVRTDSSPDGNFQIPPPFGYTYSFPRRVPLYKVSTVEQEWYGTLVPGTTYKYIGTYVFPPNDKIGGVPQPYPWPYPAPLEPPPPRPDWRPIVLPGPIPYAPYTPVVLPSPVPWPTPEYRSPGIRPRTRPGTRYKPRITFDPLPFVPPIGFDISPGGGVTIVPGGGTTTRPPDGIREVKVRSKITKVLMRIVNQGTELIEALEIFLDNSDAEKELGKGYTLGEGLKWLLLDGGLSTVDTQQTLIDLFGNEAEDRWYGDAFGEIDEALREGWGQSTTTLPG